MRKLMTNTSLDSAKNKESETELKTKIHGLVNEILIQLGYYYAIALRAHQTQTPSLSHTPVDITTNSSHLTSFLTHAKTTHRTTLHIDGQADLFQNGCKGVQFSSHLGPHPPTQAFKFCTFKLQPRASSNTIDFVRIAKCTPE